VLLSENAAVQYELERNEIIALFNTRARRAGAVESPSSSPYQSFTYMYGAMLWARQPLDGPLAVLTGQ
jgi:hypothetical protein